MNKLQEDFIKARDAYHADPYNDTLKAAWWLARKALCEWGVETDDTGVYAAHYNALGWEDLVAAWTLGLPVGDE